MRGIWSGVISAYVSPCSRRVLTSSVKPSNFVYLLAMLANLHTVSLFYTSLVVYTILGMVSAKIRIRDTAARNDLHIHLYALTRMGHLLIWLRFVRIFRLFSRKQTHFSHDTEQALRAASVAALPQTMPEFNHAQGWISAAHVPDEFPFCFRMLVWMAVRPPGLTGKGCRTSIPALLPEVDVRPALVVFRLARLTPYFSAYFMRDCRYAMSCAILLFMRDMVSFRQVVVWQLNFST